MAFVSVTRLRIRSAWHMVPFIYHTWRSVRQLKRMTGFLEGQLAYGDGRAFWTITAWRDEEAMRRYRNTGAHMRAMPKLLDWCDEASVVHWEQEAARLPEPAAAQERMLAEGRISKVRNPSKAQADRQIPTGPPPRVATQIRPAARAQT